MTAYMLWWEPNRGSGAVSDSFVCSWDTFFPIGLPCPAMIQGFVPNLLISFYDMPSWYPLEAYTFQKGKRRLDLGEMGGGESGKSGGKERCSWMYRNLKKRKGKHGFWQQHRLWTSIWSPVLPCTMDLSMFSSDSRDHSWWLLDRVLVEKDSVLFYKGWTLRVWPCTSEYMSNTNWAICCLILLPFLVGNREVRKVRRQTWENWKVSVIRVHDVKFPNVQ